MKILGIETSCDETGVAIYDEEKGLIANQLYTQINITIYKSQSKIEVGRMGHYSIQT